jgi:hypothetical protein
MDGWMAEWMTDRTLIRNVVRLLVNAKLFDLECGLFT